MNRARPGSPLLLVLGAALLLAGWPREAGAYDPLTWYTVDGGGVAGAIGGSFRLSGTIAQHDPGGLASGAFVLSGGFWRGGAAPNVDVAPQDAPLAFAFRAPSPNPVRARARLSFDLPAPTEARLRVFDVSGRALQTTEFGRLPAGRHELEWTPTDDARHPLPRGLYFMRLDAGARRAMRKLLVLR